ncbi:MAG: LD-carboxypeptidase [Phormidesmis sp.]
MDFPSDAFSGTAADTETNVPIQIPSALVPGDLLCVITPSGGLQPSEKFEAGLDIWRQRGYKLHLCEGYDERWGYLAGRDDRRRQQLLGALNHPDCKGILCARGGYGSTRLLENWTWPPVDTMTDATAGVSSCAKWLIGFSDITSLLWSLRKQGIAGVHGPVLTTLAEEPAWSIDRLFDWVEHHRIAPLRGRGWGEPSGGQHGCGGQASGILLPGNLCVATHLLGTPAEPDLSGVILAFEDVGEAPYRLDRMLTQWRSMGKFSQIKGIALGRFSRWQQVVSGPTLSVAEVMRDRLGDLGLPVVSDLPFGHDGENAALPVGLPVQLDADTGELTWKYRLSAESSV